MIRPALLSSVLLCAACAAEAPPLPPLVAPRSESRRISWEQFCEQATSVPHANVLASARGAEGWELVAMYNGVLCYKRPSAAGAAEIRRDPPPLAPNPYVPIVRDPGF